MGDFTSESREVKYHLTPLAGVVIPALQALVSGVAVGVMIGSLAYIFGVAHFLAVGLLSTGLGGGLAWLISLSWWRSRVYRSNPPRLPGVMGSGEVLRLQVAVTDPGSAFERGVWASLPVDRDALIEIARKLARGANFSHASLSGKYAPMSRKQYEAVRDEFLRRGLVYWNSPHSRNQGLSLSRAGVAAVRRLAEMDISPPPRSPRARYSLRNRGTSSRAHTRTRPDLDADDDLLDDVWNH